MLEDGVAALTAKFGHDPVFAHSRNRSTTRPAMCHDLPTHPGSAAPSAKPLLSDQPPHPRA